MLQIRKASERGQANHGWLDTRHTFSFGDYYDEQFMGFGPLRVLNDDRVQPGQGFGTHPHRDMEILSFVLEGELEHKDSMGTGSRIRPGDVQRMSAGTGVLHSEFNPSKDQAVHFLQVWIVPEKRGLLPSYEQKRFEGAPGGGLVLVASRDGRDGSLTVHQDASVYRARLASGQRARHPLAPGRSAWVHLATGTITVNGQALAAGDGVALTAEDAVVLEGGERADVLVFDLPA